MDYTPIIPTKKQLACNAIRDMFLHKHYNGVVPIADLEVVKNGKQWHRVFTKKAVQDAVKELIKEGYINLDKKSENWLWGFTDSYEPKDPEVKKFMDKLMNS